MGEIVRESYGIRPAIKAHCYELFFLPKRFAFSMIFRQDKRDFSGLKDMKLCTNGKQVGSILPALEQYLSMFMLYNLYLPTEGTIVKLYWRHDI